MVFKEGSLADYVYIIKKGELIMSKEIVVTQPLKVVIGNYGRPLPTLKKNKSIHEGMISIAESGELIGDDDVLNSECYTKTCKVYSTASELLQISSIEFKRRIRNEDSLSILEKKNQFRNLHLTSTLKIITDIQNPKELGNKTKNPADIKFLKDIKSLNPWNLSVKSNNSLIKENHSQKFSFFPKYPSLEKKKFKSQSWSSINSP